MKRPKGPIDDYQSFCIYCQREYETFPRLKTHLRRMHKGTYAQLNLAPTPESNWGAP